jgi:hypothetical protein
MGFQWFYLRFVILAVSFFSKEIEGKKYKYIRMEKKEELILS